MNKKIAIVGWKTGENSFGATVPYMEFFSQFGDVEIISATETEVRKHLDLVVLPGGPDVDPGRYNADSLSYNIGKQCPYRERFDRVLLSKYINNGTPLFGICRGHQSLAVHFGCTLDQDMYHPSNTHDRSELKHKINITGLKKKYANYVNKKNQEVYWVNSIHHQSVNMESVKKNPNVELLATYNGDVEILQYNSHPAFSVQYHPEEMWDEISIDLINLLLESKMEKNEKIVVKMAS